MILMSGLSSMSLFPIACMRWVLPSPGPPYMKSGLNVVARSFVTASAAARANLLLLPDTKVLKV